MWASASKLIDSAVFLALFTAALYSIGLAEYSGFLNFYGLSVSVLDLDAYQLLYRGLLASYLGIATLVMVITAIYFLYAHVALDFFICHFREDYKNKKNIVQRKIKLRGRRKRHPALTVAISRSNQLIMFCILVVGFLFVLAYFERSGSTKASNQLLDLRTNVAKKNSVNNIDIELNNQKMTLALLACGSRNCAALDMETKRIHYFPQGIFSFRLVGSD